MPKKKNNELSGVKIADGKKIGGDLSEEEPTTGEESTIDSAIIEDTFTEEFSEYNDVDNF